MQQPQSLTSEKMIAMMHPLLSPPPRIQGKVGCHKKKLLTDIASNMEKKKKKKFSALDARPGGGGRHLYLK